MKPFPYHFRIRHLLLLTFAAAVFLCAFKLFSGPSLDDRMVQAAERGNSLMFAALIALGAQVDRGHGTGGYDTTPLLDAAYDGNLGAVELYLDHGAYVNYREKDSFTAINYAAMEGHWEVVLRLHEAGADCRHRDATGSTAIDYAIAQGRHDIAEKLRKPTCLAE